MSRAQLATSGYLAGASVASWGGWDLWGRGYGLLIAGVTLILFFLLLFDVDERPVGE